MVTTEAISELFDNEIEPNQLLAVVGDFEHDPTMRERWTVFAMISDAMAGVPWPDDGYSLRVFERLRGVEIDSEYDPLMP